MNFSLDLSGFFSFYLNFGKQRVYQNFNILCVCVTNGILSVTELYFYFKPPVGCSDNNLISGGRPPSQDCVWLGNLLSARDEEKWERSGPRIPGPHIDSEMLFGHSGVWFSVFWFWS